MPDPEPDNSVVEFNSTHSAPISYENYSGDCVKGGRSYHDEFAASSKDSGGPIPSYGHKFSLSTAVISDESTTKYSTFENDMVRAVQKVQHAFSNPTKNSKINRGSEAGPLASQGTSRSAKETSRQKQLDTNWHSGHPEMNHGNFNLGSLVDESIPKPIMRQIMKEDSNFLERQDPRCP